MAALVFLAKSGNTNSSVVSIASARLCFYFSKFYCLHTKRSSFRQFEWVSDLFNKQNVTEMAVNVVTGMIETLVKEIHYYLSM